MLFHLWFKPIDPSDPKYEMVSEGTVRKLLIKKVASKDEGKFSCSVQGNVTTAKMYVARKYCLFFQFTIGSVGFL